MFIETGVACRFDLNHLWKRAILQIVLEIIFRGSDRADVRWIFCGNGLSPLKVLHIAGFQKASRVVRWTCAAGVGWFHIDLPIVPSALKFLKNCSRGQ